MCCCMPLKYTCNLRKKNVLSFDFTVYGFMVHKDHVDNSVNSQRISKILSLSHSAENLL